jgi:collagenase-like PrtC family protease
MGAHDVFAIVNSNDAKFWSKHIMTRLLMAIEITRETMVLKFQAT